MRTKSEGRNRTLPDALVRTGRPIVLSFCQYGWHKVWEFLYRSRTFHALAAGGEENDFSLWQAPEVVGSHCQFLVGDNLSARGSASGTLKSQFAPLAVEGIQKACWITQAREKST